MDHKPLAILPEPDRDRNISLPGRHRNSIFIPTHLLADQNSAQLTNSCPHTWFTETIINPTTLYQIPNILYIYTHTHTRQRWHLSSINVLQGTEGCTDWWCWMILTARLPCSCDLDVCFGNIIQKYASYKPMIMPSLRGHSLILYISKEVLVRFKVCKQKVMINQEI